MVKHKVPIELYDEWEIYREFIPPDEYANFWSAFWELVEKYDYGFREAWETVTVDLEEFEEELEEFEDL